MASGDGDAGEAAADDPQVPESQPAIWTEFALGEFTFPSVLRAGFWSIGGEVWFTSPTGDSSIVVRSDDGGRTFTEVIVDPLESGGAFQQSRINGFVDDGAGTIVGWGERGRGCEVNDVGGHRCSRFRAVIHLSTDGGVTWEQLEPPAMAPPGDSNMRIDAVTHHAGGFVAVTTVEGPDWHGRVYSSVDGRTWELARELRSDRGSVSALHVHSDGSTLLVQVAEKVCAFDATSNGIYGDTERTWRLPISIPSYSVVYIGSSIGELAPLTHADLELGPEPREVDCATADLWLAQEPYPWLASTVAGGRLVVFDNSEPPAPDEGESDEEPTSSRRWATLGDDGWTVTSVDGIRYPPSFLLRSLTTIGGELGVFELGKTSYPLNTLFPILPDGAGDWHQVELSPFAGKDTRAATSVDGAILVAASNPIDPETAPGVRGLADLVIHRYGNPPDTATCDLVAAGSCRFARLDLVEGYPDFTGRDLTGIDLSFADLAGADFRDAVLDGATMTGVASDGASFGGASLHGVDLTHAHLSDAGGADLTGADLTQSNLEISAAAVLSGANLTNARIDGLSSDEPIVMSLAETDLASAWIDGPRDGPLIVITDLTGAIINEYSNFSGVDLTDTILGDIDITVPSVWDDAICPDGVVPTGGIIGNCLPPE